MRGEGACAYREQPTLVADDHGLTFNCEVCGKHKRELLEIHDTPAHDFVGKFIMAIQGSTI